MIRSVGFGYTASLLGMLLMIPFSAQPAAVSANGTCFVGDCSNVDQLTSGSTSGNFNFDVTVNGDQYQVSGAYSADFASTGISVTPTITYIGANPTAQSDNISLDFLQDFYSPQSGTWAGIYSATIPLTLSAPGSTVTATPSYDDDSIGTVGPYTGPGSWTPTVSRDLEDTDFAGDPMTFEANLLTADFNFDFTFAAGTTNGEGGGSPNPSSSTPEPATAMPCIAGLISLALGARRMRSSR